MDQATHSGKWVVHEVWISQLGYDSSHVYITAWRDQLKKRIAICIDTGATRSILRNDLVEAWNILVVNQQEQLLLQIATGESSTTLGSVHMKLILPASAIRGMIIVAEIYNECILGFELIRKYDVIVDLKSRLLWALHGCLLLLPMETSAVQRIHSEVDTVQELVYPCMEILSAEQIESLKKTLLEYCDVFAQHDNDLGQISLIQHQINIENHLPIKQVPRRVSLWPTRGNRITDRINERAKNYQTNV